jgi:hypothetical protein
MAGTTCCLLSHRLRFVKDSLGARLAASLLIVVTTSRVVKCQLPASHVYVMLTTFSTLVSLQSVCGLTDID